MSKSSPTASLEELLAESEWLTRLARRLADSEAEAQDAVQETYLAASQSSPTLQEGLRPWLGTVLRNALRGRARAAHRRERREEQVGSQSMQIDVPRPDALLERAQTQHELAGRVLALREPYRRTVLSHIYAERSLAEIARVEGAALSTVRWRYREALRLLREDLSEERSLKMAIAPLLSTTAKGAIVAKKSHAAWIPIAALLALLSIGASAWFATSRNSGNAVARSDGQTLVTPAKSAVSASSQPFAQRDFAASELAGIVLLGDRPVPQARVELFDAVGRLVDSVASHGDGTFKFEARSFDSGSFEARSVASWTVVASTPQTTAAFARVDLRAPGSRDRPVRLVLRECDAPIEGVVRDASGGVVIGAEVSQRVHGQRVAKARTDSRGHYRLCTSAPWPGKVELLVSAAGYGTTRGITFAYQGGHANILLAPEASIDGHVVDERGKAIAGVALWLQDKKTSVGIHSTSDALGNFTLAGLEAGTYTIHAAFGDKRAHSAPIQVLSGDNKSGELLTLRTGRRWTGVVHERGEAAAGVPIRMAGSRNVLAYSQHDGRFTIDGLTSDAFDLDVSPWQLAKPQSIPAGDAPLALGLEVQSRPTLTGYVTRDGNTVADAIVRVEGAHEVEEVRTDVDGQYTLRGLRAGAWLVVAQDNEGRAFGRSPAPVELAAAGETRVDVELVYQASIAGQVTSSDGSPVGGVVVEFACTSRDDLGMARTDERGHFRAGMMMGNAQYTISVRREHRRASALNVVEPIGPVALATPNTSIEKLSIVVEEQSGSVTGRVVEADGMPAADYSVHLVPVTAGWTTHLESVTSEDGHFAFEDLDIEHTYEAYVDTASGFYKHPQTVRANEALRIALPAESHVHVELRGFSARPNVVATRLGKARQESPRAAERLDDDSFVFSPLAAGRYLVAAGVAGEYAAQEIEVSPGIAARLELTASTTGSIRGRLKEHYSQTSVTGGSCRAVHVYGERLQASGFETSVVVDPTGAFELRTIPSGDIAVVCSAVPQFASDGQAILELAEGDSQEVEVTVVAVEHDGAARLADLGAALGGGESTHPRLQNLRVGGPAELAGLKEGDLIVKVDGESIGALSPGGVRTLLMNHGPGAQVVLTVERQGAQVDAAVVLGGHTLK